MAGLYISTQPLHALHLPAEAVMTPLPQRGRALAAVLGLLATLALPSLLAAQTRTVRGSVIDSATGQPVQSVSVVVVGTRLGALTTGDGSYIIRGVPAGPQTVRVARIGYVPQTRAIGGTETGEIVANFRIDRSAVQLEQVVTTVTGAQRKVELGHAIAQVKADSVLKETPVYNISDLLTSRVPSAMVDASSGLTGQVMKIRIRGLNSFTLTNDPLVIVDGA